MLNYPPPHIEYRSCKCLTNDNQTYVFRKGDLCIYKTGFNGKGVHIKPYWEYTNWVPMSMNHFNRCFIDIQKDRDKKLKELLG